MLTVSYETFLYRCVKSYDLGGSEKFWFVCLYDKFNVVEIGTMSWQKWSTMSYSLIINC
jgi:hypothetical protein